ncbi:tyrosyl-tRNA synthetase [Boothiomyces macroporosus]|uniref:Tyrosine--tRNA ligase n=1 Tax=Boothiomyces macroporosus TaxID=261099 RepID=A0AAD5UEF6_9FUNG|nr:tyrosyl-tRNA synthetase [Boothiomyces macroporosus]
MRISVLKFQTRFHSQVIKNLESRFQITCTREINLSRPTTIYTGFDPTAKSLHVGNLLTIMALLQFQTTGHQVIALIGGATGSIGDPSGKKTERAALDKEAVKANTESIISQLELLFSNAKHYCHDRGMDIEKPVRILNNLDWFQQMSMLEFIGDVGRKARVTQMLGGSDQWGNITTGLDLIRRYNLENEQDNEPAYGITIPLVTTPTGEKFGKSEGNAIWLDKSLLSFFRKSPDANIQQLLEYFTLLPIEEINVIMEKHLVTELVHGKHEARKAIVMSTVLYESSFEELKYDDIHLAFSNSSRLAAIKLQEMPIADFIIQVGSLPSKSAVRKMIASGGLYINKQKATMDQIITRKDFIIDNRFLLVSVGKSKYKLVEYII